MLALPDGEPFLVNFWGDEPIEDPLIIGNCNELGGSKTLLSYSAVVALLRLLVSRGDKKARGRPPGVVVSAS